MTRAIRLWIVCLAAALVLVAGCAGQAAPPPAAPDAPAAAEPVVERAGEQAAEAITISRQYVSASGVTVAVLSNGLTVIVQENHNVPVVTVQAAVRAGGLYEGPWLGCGLSHLLEHLVAKGATRGAGHIEGPKESRDRLDAIGAQSNAYTSLDKTLYYVSCAASRAGEAVDILADWLARPEISREDYLREHGVVQRELEMGRDDTGRQLWYAHAGNFYGGHPAGVPVIGYLDALRTLTYRDVLDYHARMYVPGKMVLVVVGDVTADWALDRVRRAVTGFAARRSPPILLPDVPPLTGVRRLVVPSDTVKETSGRVSFRTIPLVHPDLYALDVLSYALTNGSSSRLHRALVREKKLATTISSGSWTPAWGAGQFTFSYRCKADQADAVEAALLDELQRVIDEPITEAELTKAKRQKVSDFVYGQQTIESQAGTLVSDFLSTGDVEFSRRYTDAIQAVTADQVRAMAAKYFDFDAMAITRMVPAEAVAAITQKPDAAENTDRAERFVLPNGMTVILSPTDTVDLVAMNLAVLGGVLAEDEATNGLGTLMTRLSLKGGGERSAEQIAEFFDRAGGAMGAMCGNNTFMWNATVLKADALEALAALADVVVRPTYPDSELEILRPRLLSVIQSQDENWHSQMSLHFRRKFYTNCPYRLLPLGCESVIGAADREAIGAHHDKWVKGGAAVLSIFGNFDPAAMRSAVETHFAEMPPGEATQDQEIPARRRVADGGERYVLKTTNQVAAIMIGWPGMTLDQTADRDAIAVLDTIISGYDLPRGWLHSNLRGRKLVYVVHAYNWPGRAPGAFVVYANTQPDKAAEVVRIIRRQIARTLTHEYTQAEINEAVNIILTSELLGSQTAASLSQQSTLDELYGFGYDYRRSLERRLRAVTPADLERVARQYLAGGAVETITTPQPDLLDAGAAGQ